MAVPTIVNPGGQTSNILDPIAPLVVTASEKPITEWKLIKPLPAGLSGAAVGVGKDYEITGTPTTKETVTVGLKAKNVTGESAEATFEWKIKEEVPVIAKPLDQISHVGIAIVPVTVVTTGGAVTEFSAPTNLPKGLSIVKSGAKIGEITGTPDTVKAEVTVELKVRTADGTNSAIVPFGWTIEIDTPVVTEPANQNTGVGVSVSLPIVASGAPTVYAATGLPAGLSINTETGIISGVPQTPTQTEAAVKVKAENAGGPSAEVLFGWKIVQGQKEANALAAKTPQAGWVAPDLWPALHG